MSVVVQVENVGKVFTKRRKGRTTANLAVRGVELKIEAGEFICFIGPSGCGKTTVLNMISGAVAPTEGRILHKGQDIAGLEVGMGYVTQEDTLLPWRTLRRNVALGLELTKASSAEIDAKVGRYIEMAGLTGFEEHYPHQLSGGMQKRAALIRTLVTEPSVVLMDEPFGAVDAQTRLNLQQELLRLWHETKPTMIFVTHDIVEAIALADRIVCFGRNPGRVRSIIDVELPRPRDVYHIHEVPGYAELYSRVWREVHDNA